MDAADPRGRLEPTQPISIRAIEHITITIGAALASDGRLGDWRIQRRRAGKED